MSIRSVLVSLQRTHNTSAVLGVAVDLARRHQADLTGLHVVPRGFGKRAQSSADYTTELELEFRAHAEDARLDHEWRCIDGSAESVIALESRCHDILVMGQADPTVRDLWTNPHDLLETVLIRSGHPIIAVPYRGSYPNVGQRVLIGWNGAREAARATEAAMPILKAAQRVIVLTVDERRGDALSVEQLVTFLERHDVAAEARGARSHGAPISDTILSKAIDLQCDLLVIGGYGHSRVREHLFGGPTYSVIEHMSLPVLMSH